MVQSLRNKKRGLRPGHLVILLLFLALRQGFAAESVETTSEATKSAESEAAAAQGVEEEEAVTSFQVFHINFQHVQIPFIIALWIFVSSLAKVGFHMTPKLHLIFPESCLLVVIGILIGFLLYLTSGKAPTTLTPQLFFLFMLPPIILDAGYFMPNRLFFDHLGTILLMAIVGTIWNVLSIGAGLYFCGWMGLFGPHYPNILETFLFSSLISAVDPVAVLAVFEEIQVDEILYIVVFGESLLNDAVTVVLYDMFETYAEIGQDNLVVGDFLKGFASFFIVALGGTLIGIIWGYLTGFVTRFTSHARILEPLFVFTMAYLSYLTAEMFKMSPILAITFCGITMKNYVERNISSKSQTTLKYAMKMLSGSSETIIFMFLGVATIHDDHDWNWAFVSLTIFFATVFRAIGVLMLSALANRYRLHKLCAVDQFVMMYGGLRGAVAFALVLLIDDRKVPHASMFVTTTIAMVYWTVFVQGITIKPLVKFLNVKTQDEKELTMNERIAGRFMDHVVTGIEGVLGEFGNLRLRDMYKRIDQKYIKPCLLRENHLKDPKIIETFENLTNKDAVEFMKRHPTEFAGLSRTLGDVNADSSAKLSSALLSMSPSVENLDMTTQKYQPSRKDFAENKIHHMLTENMFMPRNRPRRMSYSRHAVDDADLVTEDVLSADNFKVHMQVRRMVSEKKKKRKLTGENGNARSCSSNQYGNGSKPLKGIRVTGSSKKLKDAMIHQVIQETVVEEEPEEEEGITFTTLPAITLKPPQYSDNEDGKSTDTGREGSYSNPAFEIDDWESTRGSLSRSDSGVAIQQTFLPWKTENTQSDGRSMEAIKQQEFPPSWIASQEDLDEEDREDESSRDDHNTLPPPAIHFLRRGSYKEPGSEIGVGANAGDRLKGRRHSELELEHEALAPQVQHHMHHLHGKRSQKRRASSKLPEAKLDTFLSIPEQDEGEQSRSSGGGAESGASSDGGRGKPRSDAVINVEDEVHKL